ncbi:MAG: protein yggU [Fibrobacteres bacterium]|nr:protein yggU [Fibrobacterota bacterium]
MGAPSKEDLATLDLRSGDGFTLLRVKVTPKASRNEITGVADGVLRIRIQAPPVDGAANDKARDFLAGVLGRPRSALRLEKGQTSREKTFRIEGMDPQLLRDRLAAPAP